MSVNCDPTALANAARCFSCIPVGEMPAVMTYLLRSIAGLDSTDPQTLANLARCFDSCIPPGMQPAVRNYLLCQIVNGGITPGDCPQDMQFSWTPAASKLGEALEYSRDFAGGASGFTSIAFSGVVLQNFAFVHSTDLTSFSIPNVTTITATLNLSDNSALISVSSPVLASLDSLNVGNCDALPSLAFPSLTSVTSSANFQDNNVLTSLSLPLLASVGGDLSFATCTLLASVALTSLATVGSDLRASDNPALTALALPALTSVGTNFTVQNDTLLASLTAANLATITSDFDMRGCSALATLTLTNLATVGGLFRLETNALVTLSLPSLTSQGGQFAANGTGFTTMTFAAAGIIFGGDVLCDLCPNLVTINLGPATFTDGTAINFGDAKLNVAAVDAILHRAVVSGVTSCNINLAGGTNAAPSNPVGLADKAALILAGNTVATN